MINIDNKFLFVVDIKIINYDDFKLCAVEKCWQKYNWLKWEEARTLTSSSMTVLLESSAIPWQKKSKHKET